MSRLMVLGMLPLAALAASEGGKGSNALTGATKAESGGSTKGLFPSLNNEEQNNGNGDQRRGGLGWWSEANSAGLVESRQLQASGCGNGIAGIRSSGGDGFICCIEECGVCGGPGCSSAAGEEFDGSHCCVSDIATSGRMCDVTGEAPCIIDDGAEAGCGNGIAGVRSEAGTGNVCCIEECGVCGGAGCSQAAGAGFDGTHCCVSAIEAAGQTCAETGEAPCLIDSGDEDGGGGIDGFVFSGCYLVEGTDPFSEIIEDGNMTPELCFQTCAASSSLYMGLLKGNECGCGDDPNFLASDKTDGVCDDNCAGDALQTCGGALAYDLFELTDDDPTDDESDDVDRTNPGDDEMTGFLYNGCFEESSFNPFTYINQINFMTIRLCSESCGAMGAAYAGLMDGDVCGCGSEEGYLESDKEEGLCLVECAGDDGRTEICGGETAFVLMEIIYGGSTITNSVTANAQAAPSPAPEPIAELNSDAVGVVAAPSADAVLTAYTHLGCFGFEMENNPFFSIVQMDGLTYHMCSEACGALDAVYTGVIDGDMCGCGSEEGYLLSLKPEGVCDVECAGLTGDTDTCGGSDSFDLFLINYLATDDDYFGPDSAAAAAGPSTSGRLEEGGPPSSTDDDDTGDVDSTTDFETGASNADVDPAVAVATMTGFLYEGCFQMEATLDPFSTLIQMADMTLTSCNEFCGASGYVYAAVMSGDMCGCGSDAGYLTQEKEAGTCLVECAGDDGRTEICGGTDSFDLFSILYMVEDGTGESAGSGTSSVTASDEPEMSASSGTAYGSPSDEPEVDEFTGYIYDGCYAIEADFDPFSSIQQMDAMTRRACSEMCGTTGAAYSGVMDGDLCGCGSVANYLESEKAEGECLMECTGDDGRTEFCGGTASFDLFEIFYQNDDA